jgi:hypothetical protein
MPLDWEPKISDDTVAAFINGRGNFFFPVSAEGEGEEAKADGLTIVILLIVPTFERRLRNGRELEEAGEEGAELSKEALFD